MRVRTFAHGVAVTTALLSPAALAAAAGPAPAGTHVSVFRAPGAVLQGDRTPVTGRVNPLTRTDVQLQRLDAAQGWVPLVTLRSDATGRFQASLPIDRSMNIRALVVDAEGVARESRRRFVNVVPRVSLDVRPARYESIAGRLHVVTGRVSSAARGSRVAVEGRRAGHGGFRTVTTLTAGRSGRVSGTFTPAEGGEWTYRVVVPRVPGEHAGAVAVDRISTFDANPHRVPRNASHYIVQEINQFLLYYYEDGRLLRVLPVVFGKPSTPTPSGTFRVYSKTTGPSPAFGPLVLWYHRGYGIHGTNQEYLLREKWRFYSHGCTRNWNANIRWLWPRVPVGTPVVNIRS